MPTQLIRSAVAILVIALSAMAGPTATLTGRVTDLSGLAIARATVEAHAIETNTMATGETDSAGFYSIPNLAPGLYRVIVRKTGLRTIVKPGLELHVQDV